MKLKMIKAVVIASIFAVNGFANAALIDFSSMVNGVYSGNSDFSVTTYGGPESDASLTPVINNGRLCNSSDVSDTNCNYPTEDIIDFYFNVGLTSVTLDMYWAGNPGTSSSGVTATSFDMFGNVLQSFGYLAGTNATYTFASVSDIYSIRTNTNLTTRDNWWYGINSIDYTVSEVSAPSMLGFIALGLFGLCVRRFTK